jgi:ZIP family zinc transporter
MNNVWLVILFTLAAGLAMPAGALIARTEHFQSQWFEDEFRHLIIAFGGGALLSAVALVLIPEGIANLSLVNSLFFFIAGSIVFMGIDILLVKIDTPASQLAAMLADFIPESIALGAAFATGKSNAVLLAALIGLQNLPEGFNAFREMRSANKFAAGRLLLIFCGLALFGPVAGLSGYFWLADYPEYVSAIMLFASGGILYSIFQDIAPQVKLDKHWFPPMGGIFGFALGLIGYLLTEHG